MSTATTQTTAATPEPFEVPGPVALVPTLDELERLTAIPDRRVVFRGVDWAFYEILVDRIPEGSHIRVAYDGGDLEIMGNGPDHEDFKESLGHLIKLITEELGIPCKGLGQTTWRRPEVSRGLEADLCYFFDREKRATIARLKGSKRVSDYPAPDLAIEVDISRPEVDRSGIYGALGVVEIWRFDGETVVIERLTAAGHYETVDASGFLTVCAIDIRRWLVDEDRDDDTAWAVRIRNEIRTSRDSSKLE